MKRINKIIVNSFILGSLCALAASMLFSSVSAGVTNPPPQSSSLGLEATIPSGPPTFVPTIVVPISGQSYSSNPVAVSGLCTSQLLTKVFVNNIFSGSTVCSGNSYSLRVDLFNGKDDIYAQDFDNLGQGSPQSNVVTVNFSGGQAPQPQNQVLLTSNYAKLGANPGQVLDWPIIISGGTPPYAISTDWGDGQPSTLQSSAYSGQVTIKHTYTTSGVYTVTVTATDSNGSTAFLQLVGVANGQIVAANKANPSASTATKNNQAGIFSYWWVLLIIIIALGPAFWLGVRHGRAVTLKNY